MLQVAQAVADLWDYPDRIEIYRHRKKKQMELLETGLGLGAQSWLDAIE